MAIQTGYRFSFASREDEEAFNQQQQVEQTTNMLENIEKTNEYLGKKKKAQKEYELSEYRNKTESVEQLKQEMMMRPTVHNKDLDEVK